MDTCDRYELHEAYKDKLKKMMSAFTVGLLHKFEIISEEGEGLELFDIQLFIDDWVENNCRPMKFNE